MSYLSFPFGGSQPTSTTITVFNVKDYGALGNGVADDTAAIQAAFTAAYAAGGAVYFPLAAPYYTITSGGTLLGVTYAIRTPGPVPFFGAGKATTTLRVANGTITGATTQYMVFITDSAWAAPSPWGFSDITIDGNSANQVFSGFSNATYYGVIATLNQPTTINADMTVRNAAVKNFSMGVTPFHGTGLNTYGWARQNICDIVFTNCDYGVFVTQPAYNGGTTDIIGCKFHNIGNIGVYIEGLSNVGVLGCDFYNDALPTPNNALAAPIGIAMLQRSVVRNLRLIGNGFLNLSIPMYLGLSGGAFACKNSIVADCTAYNCRGGFNIQYFDESSIIENCTAESCALGSITGTTVYGSFELNAGAVGTTVARGLNSVNSGAGSIVLLGKTILDGGMIVGGTSTVTFNDKPNSVVRNVRGYNPIGYSAAPAVPTSGTAATNNLASDATVYVAGGTSVTIAINGNLTGIASGTFRVAAGQTITPTYSAAPTWLWFLD